MSNDTTSGTGRKTAGSAEEFTGRALKGIIKPPRKGSLIRPAAVRKKQLVTPKTPW